MQVDIFDVTQFDDEQLGDRLHARNTDLRTALGDDADENFDKLVAEISGRGVAMWGGGASPLYRIVPAAKYTVLTWLELSKLAEGTEVVFPYDHDVFPECIIPAGSVAVIVGNELNELSQAICVRPNSAKLRAELSDGELLLVCEGDDAAPDATKSKWTTVSPLAVLQ